MPAPVGTARCQPDEPLGWEDATGNHRKQPPSATQKVMRVGSKDPGSVLSDFLEGSEVVVGKEIDGHDGLRARG